MAPYSYLQFGGLSRVTQHFRFDCPHIEIRLPGSLLSLMICVEYPRSVFYGSGSERFSRHRADSRTGVGDRTASPSATVFIHGGHDGEASAEWKPALNDHYELL